MTVDELIARQRAAVDTPAERQVLANQNFVRHVANYDAYDDSSARGNDRGGPVGRRTFGQLSGLPQPTAVDRARANEIVASDSGRYVKKDSWLQKFETKVFQPVVKAVVVVGIGVGAAGVAGVGPAAGTTTSAAAPVTNAGMTAANAAPAYSGQVAAAKAAAAAAPGVGKVASFASLVKPVLSLGTAAAGLVGSVKALSNSKGIGMTAEAGFPAYADQLQPTVPAGIVKAGAFGAGNNTALLVGVAVLVAVILSMKG